MAHHWDDRPSPAQATVDWHREAGGRDAARLAGGPDDDTETNDGPWAWNEIDPDPCRPMNDTVE